jgi:autotransporter-associated beta strand protein
MKPKYRPLGTNGMKKAVLASGLTIGMCLVASAQTTRTWTGATDSNLNTAGNWSPAASPTTNDTLNFNGTDTTTSGANALIMNAVIGGATGVAAVNVTQSNALDFTATSGNGIRLNNGGTFTVSAGAGPVTFGSNARFILGNGTGTTHSFTLTNNSSNAVVVAADANANWQGGTGTRNVAIGGTGDWTFNGRLAPDSPNTNIWNVTKSGAGTLEFASTGTSTFSNLNTSAGTVRVSAGILNLNATSGGTAVSGTGTVTVAGGTLNVNNQNNNVWFSIGATAGQTATMNLSSGAIDASTRWGTQVGQNGNGVLNITGGTFTATDTAGNGLKLAEGIGTTGIVNLDGGTFRVNRIGINSGTGTFYFNGGTFSPTASDSNWFAETGVNLSAQVRNGGAIIDTGAFNVTVGKALVHSSVGGDNAIDGGLTKLGAGTLTLSGANTYTGATTITGGTLKLASTSSIASSSTLVANGTLDVSDVTGFTVGADQSLGGTGTVDGNVTVAGTLAPGNSPGVLTVNGGVTFNSGSIFSWDLASLTSAPADRGTQYDGVDMTGALSVDPGAIFRIILGVPFDANDSFWKTGQQTWNVFSGMTSGSGTFGTFQLFDSTSSGSPLDFASAGSFTFDSTSGNLTWSAVPEPSSLLAGLLLGAGLVRRRR